MNFINFKIAWRNIWRNRLRSSVVISAVTVGLFGGLASTGIMKGMVIDLVESAIHSQVSHIQIHNEKFVQNNEVQYLMDHSSQMLDSIVVQPNVVGVSQRTMAFGMASTASKGVGVMIIGVEPENEKTVTDIFEKIKDGNGKYFESDKKNRIVIGEKLAKKLNAKLKSKIILTFQDYEGNLSGASFKVEGIYKTQNTTYDEMNVFVKKTDLDKLLLLPKNTSHEIAILLTNEQETKPTTAIIKKLIPNYFIEDWTEISPYLNMSYSMTSFMLLIFMSIIMLALGFAIVNTMLMVVLERTKELGMIMAIGMNRFKVFSMIMWETSMLALVGGVIGILLTFVFTWYFGKAGIDISAVGEGFEAMGYSSVMYPVLDFVDYVEVVILVMLTGLIASIFPTIRALKMKPAEATRG
jgi:ABC-type lipoprotein release transport system permease subunit